MCHARPLAIATAALLPALSACGSSSAPGRSTPATTATTSTTAAPAGATAVSGSAVSDRFGENQVTLVVRGRKILDVRYALPSDRQRSVEINAQAGPLLRQEVLQAQSANIHLVSGATYTSDAFIQSLRTAVASAHLG